MKEEIKNNQQQIYRFRIFKDFDYPSFSINKSNKIEDLYFNALEEVKENAANENFFKGEIINIMPFSLKTKSEEATGNTDYDFFIKEVALFNTEEKFGKLNIDSNPDVFRKTEQTSRSVTYHVIPEVEDYFNEQVVKYTNLLKYKINPPTNEPRDLPRRRR